jgi:hypothetical protein
MTAYISRLVSPGRPAGIRPRPRSRYEPEPETYLGADPIEVHVQTQSEMDHVRAGPLLSVDAPQRPAPQGTGGQQSRAGLAESVAAVAVSNPGPSAPRIVAAESTGRPAPPQRSGAPFDLGDDDAHAEGGRHEPRPAPDIQARVAALNAVPTAAPPIAGVPRDPLAAGQHHPSNHVAVTVPPLTGPRPAAQDARVESIHAPAPPAADTGSGTTPRRHDAQGSVAAAPPTLATGATPITKSPDPVVRQTIINAITEPTHEQSTEVVVHIDRIDVHAPTSSPPPPVELRRARAAPTSLQAYLRSQSRGAGI